MTTPQAYLDALQKFYHTTAKDFFGSTVGALNGAIPERVTAIAQQFFDIEKAGGGNITAAVAQEANWAITSLTEAYKAFCSTLLLSATENKLMRNVIDSITGKVSSVVIPTVIGFAVVNAVALGCLGYGTMNLMDANDSDDGKKSKLRATYISLAGLGLIAISTISVMAFTVYSLNRAVNTESWQALRELQSKLNK